MVVGVLRALRALLADGTSSAPAHSWANDTDLGFYRIGADEQGHAGSLAIRGPRPWVDVRAHGTTANGSAALQAAHDALPATGGEIRMHAEEYTWLAAVTISKSQVTLRGAGRQATVLKAGANIATGAIIVTGSNFTAYDFEYNGNKSSFPTGSHGIDLSGAQGATLLNIVADNCVGSGFRKSAAPAASGLTFIRCTATSNGLHGFDIQGQAAHRLFGCTALTNGGSGYNLQSTTENFLVSCDADQNVAQGFHLGDCDRTILDGCVAIENDGNGFNLSNGSQENRFMGCQAINNSDNPANTWFGFRLVDAGTQDNLIIACVANDDQGGGATQGWGIAEQSGGPNFIAFNRVFSNVQGQITTTHASTVVFKNQGFVTENNVLSGTFAIDATGVKTVTIAHGLAYTPSKEHCQLTVVEETNVDDWAYNLLKVDSVDATNVTAKINVSTASATGAATARLALRCQRH